ncbi:MAG: hypothetical protein IIB00_00775 [candidate division Zixibacteria bacterium]|nr:hypothetical protein [candidate division Zixibacteria bacterium]
MVFYLLKAETHFLGDGYSWISIFGRGDTFMRKWTEPLSIPLVRGVQWLLGSYTKDTALTAFQLISVTCGFVVVYNFTLIIKKLFKTNLIRLIILSSFLGSGLVLLFLGYVKLYPLFWATATTFLALSIRYLQEGKGFLICIFSFILTLSMHLQGLYLIGGVLLLTLKKLDFFNLRRRSRSFGVVAIVAFASAFAWFLIWSYNNFLEIEVIFLPLLEGRPESPGYFVFGTQHLLDILNLALLIFPGSLILVYLIFRGRAKLIRDDVAKFLGVCSIGSTLFLLVIDPRIGMGRDWDLMSFTLVCPFLFMCYHLNKISRLINANLVWSYIILCGLLSGVFISANLNVEASENRFHSLLRHYGSKDRTGWVIYANYFLDKRHYSKYEEVKKELKEKHPEYSLLKDAYNAIESGENKKALQISKFLVNKNPYKADFLRVLGISYRQFGMFDSSEYYFKRALKLRPVSAPLRDEGGRLYFSWGKYKEAIEMFREAHYLDPSLPYVLEGLGMSYYHENHLDTALLIADSLFSKNKNSPAGHMLYVVLALRRNDTATAKHHYSEFLKFGRSRQDYQTTKNNYLYLED